MRSPVEPKATHQYAVRYRRRYWAHRQVRFFQSAQFARRYVKKLLNGYVGLAPLEEVWIERRELGPVEIVWEQGDRP